MYDRGRGRRPVPAAASPAQNCTTPVRTRKASCFRCSGSSSAWIFPSAAVTAFRSRSAPATEDFTTGDERYDVILDAVGNRSVLEFRRVLKPRGRYVAIAGGSGRWIDPLPRVVGAWAVSRFVSQRMGFFLAPMDGDDLRVLADLVDAGKVKPVIDRRYPLEQAPEALRYLESGHARGKVVVTVDGR